MKREWSLVIVVALTAALQLFPAELVAQRSDVEVYLFWQRGCAYCERAIRYVAGLEGRSTDVRAHYLELGSQGNRRAYRAIVERLEIERLAVPLTVIGDEAVVGYRDDATSGAQIAALVANCRRTSCSNILTRLAAPAALNDDRAAALAAAEISLDATASSGVEPAPEGPPSALDLPLLGEVDLRALSLPALTIVLGAVDGFNPCAMWVLIFLIGLLLGLQDGTRRWVLGGAFLLTSAAVYYVVIAAWLSAVLILGLVAWIRLGIGILALAGGGYYIYQFVRNPQALCRVANETRRHRIMTRLRAAATEPRFLTALGAIVVLAIGVNFVELLCSAGIPAIYAEILALTPMPTWQHYAWLALYVLVFLLDDLAIFVVAMLTLDVTGATSRYAHYAQLVGGLVLLVVGALLLFRPEWLRFA